MTSVIAITKEKTAKIIPNAVGVSTNEETHMFSSLLSREATFKVSGGVLGGQETYVVLLPPLQRGHFQGEWWRFTGQETHIVLFPPIQRGHFQGEWWRFTLDSDPVFLLIPPQEDHHPGGRWRFRRLGYTRCSPPSFTGRPPLVRSSVSLLSVPSVILSVLPKPTRK
jgi:hypothetical protein